MKVAFTSVQAYYQNEATGRSVTQRTRICVTLRSRGEPMTRREISVMTDIEPGAVAGRVKELIEIFYLVDTGARRCTVTGRTAKTVWFSGQEDQL